MAISRMSRYGRGSEIAHLSVFIPAKNIDVKIVKIWYQNGNRWTSYFADVGLKLCPELLLKDENMIKVDTANVANYARIKNGNAVTYEWISAPRELDPMTFNQYQEGFGAGCRRLCSVQA